MKTIRLLLGVTIENLFANYLGSETLLFVQYHINRSCLTLLVHSVLPLIYFLIYYLHFDNLSFGDSIFKYFWMTLTCLAVILPFAVTGLICYYKRNNWENHPIAKILKRYCNSTDQRWELVAAEVNNEYRRSNKLVKRFSSIAKIIVTENWVMKTSVYFCHFAHQSDSALIADKSDSHRISIHDSSDSVEFVNIQVKPTRPGVRPFTIRINSLDFKDLQDRVNRPITVLSSVKFHTSLIDRFIDVFTAEAKKNPRYIAPAGVVDSCFACMVNPPDVKINRNCPDEPRDTRCSNCFCRPMWCCSCLGRWFASRQDQSERETWLRNQASCPMCRATFCILDVCLLSEGLWLWELIKAFLWKEIVVCRFLISSSFHKLDKMGWNIVK